MAKFLNTSATNFFLEELIKNAKERLFLISPYLRLNDRIKELLEDKNRMKIDIRIIYGKTDLHPEEIKWLQQLDYVRVSFCKNLHAKCYLNESSCILTSLNLYEFSQVNNNEMGVLLTKAEDGQVFIDAYEEAKRIIRISDEIRISLDEVHAEKPEASADTTISNSGNKLTSGKLAAKFQLRAAELHEKMTSKGWLELKDNGRHYLTAQGRAVGGEFKSNQYGGYFLWPEDLEL